MSALPSSEPTATSRTASAIESPLGSLLALATPRGLARLEFVEPARIDERIGELAEILGAPIELGASDALARTEAQLSSYFDGQLTEFQLPLDLGGTPFQRSVWARLAEIPYGATATYLALARALGRPGAARAVGRANGQNPVSIVVPCHRVVGSDGRLTGYAGGLPRKRRLLALEGATWRG